MKVIYWSLWAAVPSLLPAPGKQSHGMRVKLLPGQRSTVWWDLVGEKWLKMAQTSGLKAEKKPFLTNMQVKEYPSSLWPPCLTANTHLAWFFLKKKAPKRVKIIPNALTSNISLFSLVTATHPSSIPNSVTLPSNHQDWELTCPSPFLPLLLKPYFHCSNSSWLNWDKENYSGLLCPSS